MKIPGVGIRFPIIFMIIIASVITDPTFIPWPKEFEPGCISKVLQGLADVNPRSFEDNEIYLAYKKKTTPDKIAHNILGRLGWLDGYEGEEPTYLSTKCFGDNRRAQIARNSFPWTLPQGMKDYLLWTRFPILNRATLELKKGEVFPSERYHEEGRLDALVEYIEHSDFVGYKVEQLEPLKTYHLNNKVYRATNGHIITREEGWEANQWAGRHLNAFLKMEFKNKEVVWTRSPMWWKGVQKIDHAVCVSVVSFEG
ncbi:secreted protein [Melampsora americana]|nr:secreted protein [Melampsora americana]